MLLVSATLAVIGLSLLKSTPVPVAAHATLSQARRHMASTHAMIYLISMVRTDVDVRTDGGSVDSAARGAVAASVAQTLLPRTMAAAWLLALLYNAHAHAGTWNMQHIRQDDSGMSRSRPLSLFESCAASRPVLAAATSKRAALPALCQPSLYARF